MDHHSTDVSQKGNDTLQTSAENSQQKYYNEPKSIDADAVTEDVYETAAAAGGREEDSVGSSPPYTSAIHVSDGHSDDDENPSGETDINSGMGYMDKRNIWILNKNEKFSDPIRLTTSLIKLMPNLCS